MGVYELSGAGSAKTPRTVYSSMNANNQYGAMVPIANVTLTSNASTFSFQNIPQTYQDLFLSIQWRDTTSATGNSYVYMTTNVYDGVATPYSQTMLYGNGSSALSVRLTAKTYADDFGFVPKNGNTTGIFGSLTAHFLNYANTSTKKTYLVRTASDLNGSGDTSLAVGLINSTVAITSFNIYPVTGILAGSTATLYGIRAVSS